MSLIKETESYLTNLVNSLGYEINEVKLEKCKMPEFGQYQINIAMNLASIAHANPRDIAQKIVDALDDRFVNVNIQGPGFINVTFNNDLLINYSNECLNDFNKYVDKFDKTKTIVLDYGGANIAKTLHVGHVRCNIGEAVKRVYNLFGDKTISDVHWGDWGTPLGLVIREIKERYPELPFFDESYTGEYPKLNITNDELGIIYPAASLRKKEDPDYANEARILTEELQSGKRGIRALWEQIVDISKSDCKNIYNYLNCTFDLDYGESTSDKYVKDVLNFLNEKGVTEESDGALIMHVKEETDNKEMPPLMLVKSDGGVLYDTTELATIYQRVKDFDPDMICYFTDNRQGLHFEQAFRGAYKSGLVRNDVELKHFEFGTINGSDGKPFKTRDGGVMSLKGLIKLVYDAIKQKIKEDIVGEERINVANKLTIATIKYSDLLPFRTTDYIFDVDKFTSFEGKTGIYILYTTTRIKSLLNKLDSNDVKIKNIPNEDVLNILVKLTELSKVLKQCYQDASLSYLCEFTYELASLFNKFYGNNNISNEENEDNKETFIALSKLVYNVLHNILNILAIDEVDKM